jgi:hypothetical protein
MYWVSIKGILAGNVTGIPQILIRVGKITEMQPPSVRRDVGEVVF